MPGVGGHSGKRRGQWVAGGLLGCDNDGIRRVNLNTCRSQLTWRNNGGTRGRPLMLRIRRSAAAERRMVSAGVVRQ